LSRIIAGALLFAIIFFKKIVNSFTSGVFNIRLLGSCLTLQLYTSKIAILKIFVKSAHCKKSELNRNVLMLNKVEIFPVKKWAVSGTSSLTTGLFAKSGLIPRRSTAAQIRQRLQKFGVKPDGIINFLTRSNLVNDSMLTRYRASWRPQTCLRLCGEEVYFHNSEEFFIVVVNVK
jgi:hypothetical protein